MMYKNSFKLIFSNFSLVWKLLVYLLICLFFCGGLIYLVNVPIFDEINLTPILADIPDMLRNLIRSFDIPAFVVSIEAMINSIVLLVTTNFVNIWYYLLIMCVVSIIIPYIVINFYQVSTSNVLHNYMGSNVNFGFTASIFLNFWKNLRYTLACVVTRLPIKVATYYLVIKSFALFGSELLIVQILAPFIIVAIYVILTALRLTLFSGWVPFMIVKNA